MKKYITPVLFSFLCFISPLGAQITIHGKVKDNKGKPVEFGTVFIKNTLIGGLTDSLGNYTLNTKERGDITLIATAIGYDTAFVKISIEDKKDYSANLVMHNNGDRLNEVDITPGAIAANNDGKVAILNTMDVYTTAGAEGDVVGAIQTLPGTQKNPSQNGLFVRGGDASESAVIVDGLVVQDPFFSPVPGVAQRTRFAPYEFSGISFSSGGYSARYGQALSGILDLNTNDLPEKSTVNVGINMAGVNLSGTQLWSHSSLEGAINYTNTQPFYGLMKTNVDFFQPPVGIGGSARYVWTNSNGDLFKISGNYNQYKSGTQVINPEQTDTTLSFNLKNYYSTGSIFYRHFLSEKTSVILSSSYSQNGDTVKWGGENFDKQDEREEARVELKEYFSNKLSGCIGAEIQRYSEKQIYIDTNLAFTEMLSALYMEGQWKPASWFGLKAGIRYEYSQILAKNDLAPRISAAIRLNKYGQISAAYGMFYQDPSDKYLLFGHTQANFQEATHYIVNYQYTQDDRTFRVEGYYKSYSDLVLEETQGPYDPNPYRPFFWPINNNGYGYAKGLDVFWRDKKTIKNFDYWISYSYIDTKRLYANFPVEATPNFVSTNNLNVVTKYFFEKPGINVSLTYSYASGKPYYNPDNPTFLGDLSPAYQDLALSVSYLFRYKKLEYFISLQTT